MQAFPLRRAGARAGMLAAALVVAGLLAAGSAGAVTYSWSVPLSGQDVIASGLPAIASATGSATLNADTAANQICGTFTWSGVADPVAFGHIHEGQYGVVENPGFTVNLFGPDLNGAPNGVTGCTVLPGPVIGEMFRFPQFFNVVVHNKQFPGGALRGQLANSGDVFCQLHVLCPGPPP
jgi:CHRD domain